MDTVQGPFTIYDWAKYRGYAGYCPGQDDISMSLELYGGWEASDWDLVRTSSWEPGTVLDFGSHIGWYSITLAQLGHRVVCFDSDPVNCELLAINARNRGYRLEIHNTWVEDLPELSYPDVRFIKADVEGAEDEVISVCASIIRHQRPTMLLECSPEFDDYYPAMIEGLKRRGYAASRPLGDTQANIWFR